MFGARNSAVTSKRTVAPKDEQERDPERMIKLKECCDMLLAGGYFRARIPTLSPFDKVVGGMVWSMTASNVGVDVDILFEENSTIGQRIKLSENIVRALVKMQCPRALQANQIQGLDYDNIFPVIQWLVRKVIETRLLTGDQVRQLSVSQFGKSFLLPEDSKLGENKVYVSDLGAKYKTQRKFKKRDDATFESEVGRVEATLLEYGEKVYGSGLTVDEEQEEKKRERAAQRGGAGKLGSKIDALSPGGPSTDGEMTEEKQKEMEEAEKRRLNALQQQLAGVDSEGKLTGQNVGKIVGMRANEIREAAAAYDEEMKKSIADGDISGMDHNADGAHSSLSSSLNSAAAAAAAQKKSEEQLFRRQAEALKRKIKNAEAVQAEKKTMFDDAEAKVAALREELNSQNQHITRLIEETSKLEELENDAGNKDVIAKLRALVVLNEDLRRQENEFKLSCKREMTRLNELIEKLETAEGDEETKKMLEIESIYEVDLAKLTKLRQVLAKKNQEIANVNRQIDDIPTRAELLQFERRFVELYDLVSEKLVETRTFYDMFNTLSETYKYMLNEVQILESIIQGFPIGMKSKVGQESMLKQFGAMIESVKQSQESVQSNLAQEKSMEEMLTQKYNKLLEKQRAYFKAVKEFQEEAQTNEQLSLALERLKGDK